MARIKGRNINIFVAAEGGGVSKAIAHATSSSLEVSKQTETTIDKDSSTVGDLDTVRDEWSMSSENIVEVGMGNATELIDALLSDKVLTVTISEIANPSNDGLTDQNSAWKVSTVGYTGKCKCTQASLNAPAEGKATISATFTGTGPLTPLGGGGTSH